MKALPTIMQSYPISLHERLTPNRRNAKGFSFACIAKDLWKHPAAQQSGNSSHCATCTYQVELETQLKPIMPMELQACLGYQASRIRNVSKRFASRVKVGMRAPVPARKPLRYNSDPDEEKQLSAPQCMFLKFAPYRIACVGYIGKLRIAC